MKYIIVKDCREDKEFAILFPNQVIHEHVARIHRVGEVQLISAGFCEVFPEAKTWGKSESLHDPDGRFHPRPEDAGIIARDFHEPESPLSDIGDELLAEVLSNTKAGEVRQKIIETIVLAQNEKPKSEQWHFHKFYWEAGKANVEVVIDGTRHKISVEESE